VFLYLSLLTAPVKSWPSIFLSIIFLAKTARAGKVHLASRERSALQRDGRDKKLFVSSA
jgi:hypothetical protein